MPAVGGGVVAADTGWRGAQGGRAVAGSGSGGKGKEPAWAEASPQAGSDGAATSAGAGAVGGWGGKAVDVDSEAYCWSGFLKNNSLTRKKDGRWTRTRGLRRWRRAGVG